MSLLEVTSLTVRYGGVTAVDSVDLKVDEGELVGLIGPNGAGKTSLIDAVTGYTPAAGTVVFADQPMTALRPHQRVRRGMSRTFQTLELFEDMTLRENLAVGAERARWWSLLADLVRPGARGTSTAKVEAALRAVSLLDRIDDLPSTLPNGSRKVAAVARALVTDPKTLLLDEPASGLNSVESRELGGMLRRLTEQGLAMLLVDHDMDLVMSVCDRLYVLDFGRLIAVGSPQELREDPRVIAAYLGHGADA
jgi:ABC-type branched-subunit amino acid transport system ATPase component